MSNSAQKNIDIPGKLWLNMILNDEGYQEILIKSLTLVVGSEVSQIEKLRNVKAIKSTLVMNEYSNENSKRDVKKIADEVFPMLSEARKVEAIRVLDAVPAVPLDKAAERYKRRVAGLDNVKLTEIYHLEPNKNQKKTKKKF